MGNRLFNILTKITEKIKTVSSTVPQIQYGRVVGSSIAANTYVDKKVTFPKKFDNVPVVIVSFVSTSVAGSFGKCTIAVNNIGIEGATIRIFNGDTTSRSPDMFWIAVGQQNV